MNFRSRTKSKNLNEPIEVVNVQWVKSIYGRFKQHGQTHGGQIASTKTSE
jgi:hypothetical protein